MTIIEVFADIWCPFAHVGITTAFHERELRHRSDVGIVVRSWPLELVNGAPVDAVKTARNVEALREQVAKSLFTDFDPGDFPTTTIPALRLASAAYQSSMDVGERVSLALRHALFEEGRNIAKSEVLDDIAVHHGLESPSTMDDDCTLTDWHEGRARGVKGSPHYFAGNFNVFCPTLDIARDEQGALHLRRTREQLATFLDESLA